MKSYINILKFLCTVFLVNILCLPLQAQNKTIKVSSAVVDETGNPISGATVYGIFGIITSGDDGSFEFEAQSDVSVIIDKDGYDRLTLKASAIGAKTVMSKPPFLSSDADEVQMGFYSEKKRYSVNSTSSVNVQDNLKFNSASLIGDFIDGLLVGSKSSRDIRGIGSAMYVVDGIPNRDITYLRSEEIESITVLKDINAIALYGSQGKNGVIVITTRKGVANKPTIRANVSSGVKVPIAYPDYLGSADYMELYNEACSNSGISVKYDAETIENTRAGINEYMYPNIDMYSSEYLKKMQSTTAASLEFSGGTDKLQYLVFFDYEHRSSLEKLNPDANKGVDMFGVRGNLNYAVNKWINNSVNINVISNNNKSAHSSVISSATSFRPNYYSPLLPVSLVSSELADQMSAINQFDGHILGSSLEYKGTTPFANILAKGYKKRINRVIQVTDNLNLDLSGITEGLSASGMISFDYYDAYTVSITNACNFYEPTWDAASDSIIGLTALGDADKKDQTENVNTTGFELGYGFYGNLAYEKKINNHYFNAMFLAYLNSYRVNSTLQADKQSHLALDLSYGYKNKLFADFTTAYSHSIKLPDGSNALSPTLGLSYIISEEDFLKDNSVINYLKLKASAGILNSDLDIDDYFLYQEIYAINVGSFTWNDGGMSLKRTTVVNGENYNLGFTKRKEYSFGFESSLFNNSLWVEASYFNIDMTDQVTQLTSSKYPSFYRTFSPYSNYNSNGYRGVEFGINYNTNFGGDFDLNVGANLLYSRSEVLEYDESVAYDYLSRIGESTGRILGFKTDGFYNEADFDEEGNLIEGLSVPQFGNVAPGDLKYIDENGDGFIDNDDRTTIGTTYNPYTLGFNARLRYKNLSFFILCKAVTGAEAVSSNDYYWVDGEDKYSVNVLNRWTPETASTASYPRLSANADNHNYKNSTFWLYDKSFFNIKRMQLTYTFGRTFCKKIGFDNLSINLSCINLLKIGPDKDILNLNIGSTPQFRTYMLGIRTSF